MDDYNKMIENKIEKLESQIERIESHMYLIKRNIDELSFFKSELAKLYPIKKDQELLQE